eukprot:gnl/MRDRNA2_/MRDRNA2_30873_c0_seq1.p1 gnl/MRDRNA2_/MRDRNA2_30873_c0~~gnl/MRDRNA2_/MRDRNA2_30873_c0_seq1.p1  ORF type:complete len:194 (+),score=23.11 gnl/MRDRNA2_/MRDRNA2_30873_c0_seq1:86-667(+)
MIILVALAAIAHAAGQTLDHGTGLQDSIQVEFVPEGLLNRAVKAVTVSALDIALLGKPVHLSSIPQKLSSRVGHPVLPASSQAHNLQRRNPLTAKSFLSLFKRYRGPCEAIAVSQSRRDALLAILGGGGLLLPGNALANFAPGRSTSSTSSGTVCQSDADADDDVKTSQISDPQKFVADALKTKGIVVFGKTY